MHFIEKKGQRLAVFDHLISTETGQHIEVPVSSPEMEASMIRAEEIGRRGLAGISALASRDKEPSSSLQNQTTG